jgi:hypothetical protein
MDPDRLTVKCVHVDMCSCAHVHVHDATRIRARIWNQRVRRKAGGVGTKYKIELQVNAMISACTRATTTSTQR